MATSARGGDWPEWPIRLKAKPEAPNSLEQIARSIDSIEDKILDDGTVVIKQPDVYSQSRMTLYRKNFESQLYNAMTQFTTVLSAKLFRSDQAAFLSQSNLAVSAAAAKSKAGSTTTTNTTVAPPTLIPPGTSGGVTPDGLASGSISRPTGLTALGSGPFSGGFSDGKTPYGLGVEPTVFLDELKRYQDHLNELRRVNMGDDIADSAGYGLYLVRMPVSIQPGECTRKGHGAILTTTLRHDFDSNFLALTFRNLAINDLVDQLSPIVYELIRSDALKTYAGLEHVSDAYTRYRQVKKDFGLEGSNHEERVFFTSGTPNNRQPGTPPNSTSFVITRVNSRTYPIAPTEKFNVFHFWKLYDLAVHAKDSLQTKTPAADDVRNYLRSELASAYDIVAQTFGSGDPNSALIVQQFDNEVEMIGSHVRNQDFKKLYQDYRDLATILPGDFRFYPPSGPNLARNGGSGITRVNHLQDGSGGNPGAGGQRENPNRRGPVTVPPALLPPPELPPPGGQNAAKAVEFDPNDSLFQVLTILCYAIAVEDGLLNEQLRVDMKRVLGRMSPVDIVTEAGVLDERFRIDMRPLLGAEGTCALIDRLRFYSPCPEPLAEAFFQVYVKKRWPIITFALDPVVDQQNIADASSVKRDLQLALAFAFSTGQINFNQLTQFQRRIEVDAETIALNRTVTAFAHGTDTFGFRFTPRYQNPPPEKSNFQVITNQLIKGGQGRNYQVKNSKLENGQRELSVAIIMPSFVPGVHMDLTGNWFPLHDPDQMKIPTPRMIEQGRKVVALRDALDTIHDHGRYRTDDVRRLRTRADQLEAMLPMQTLDVKVPYENTIGGFQLFQAGISSLVPEIDGFEGADSIDVARPGADLFLYGKHFSVQETNVIVGGVYLSPNSLNLAGSTQSTAIAATATATTPAATGAAATTPSASATATLQLSGGTAPSGSPFTTPPTGTVTTANNTAIDIISREVLRVSIPKGVAPTEIYDADLKTTHKYIEVYVATPTGISNQLLVPYADSSATAAVAPGFSIDAKSQALTVNYTLQGVVNTTMVKPVRGTPAANSDLTINWTSPLGFAPRTIQVSIVFKYGVAAITIPIRAPIVKGTNGKYKLADADLKAIAHDFIAEIAKIDPTISLSNPIKEITVDAVNITPDDPTIDAQAIKASGTLKITPQLVNDGLGQRRVDPKSDPSTLRAAFVPAPNPPPSSLALPPLPVFTQPPTNRPRSGSKTPAKPSNSAAPR